MDFIVTKMIRTSLLVTVLLLFAVAQIAPNGESYVAEPFFDNFEGSSVNNDVWQIATWEEHGGQTGRERCFVEDGLLHLHFINSSTEGFLSSAIQTRVEFFYGKWEMYAKPSGVPGVLNSFYTIDWNNTADNSSSGNGTKQEIDIEFLTKSFDGSYGEIHLALHASGKTSWDTRPDIPLWFNPSADFHLYGFDITPEYVEWFVDDSVIYRYEYSERPIAITAPYQLKLNAWSAVNWIEGPPAPDVVCDYQIDWIRFTPYQSVSIKKDLNSLTTPKRNVLINNSILTIDINHTSPLDFRLFDASGRMILQKKETRTGTATHRIDLAGAVNASGIYFYTLSLEKEIKSGRFFITK